ncbi:MAG: two-component system LytT family sensor kinase [Bacteroidia bacterium]|jgi:two-component system LytT family sensor kinase
MRVLTFLYLIGFLSLNALAQNKSSSLNIAAIERQKMEEDAMFTYLNNANASINTDANSALSLVEKALKISYQYNNKRGEAYAYQTMGAIHYQQKNYDKAVEYFEKSKKLFDPLNDEKANNALLKYLGPAYEANGQNNKAIEAYKKYLNVAVTSKKAEDELSAKLGWARVLFNSGQFKASNDVYQQLLVFYRATNNTSSISQTYEYIGKCFAGLKDTVQALRYLQLAEGVVGNGSDDQQVEAYQNVSSSYRSYGNIKKSNELENKAKVINRKRGDVSGWQANNINLANNYLLLNNAGEAIPLLQENINLAKEVGSLKGTGETFRALSEAYALSGNLEAARNSFDQYKKVQEALLEDQKKQLEASFLADSLPSTSIKEDQIALLVKDKELDLSKIALLEEEKNLRQNNLLQQKRINYFLIAVLSVLAIGLLLLFRSTKQKQMANKLLAIRSLQSQMNPHFIFNSLNSVNNFISKSDERSANKYLSEFAKLMRTVLEHSKHDFVPLGAELAVLNRYLNLEHLRFNEHFDYAFEVDENLELDKLLIPPMLIQPYIENAIWHGLRYRETKGFLSVTIREDYSDPNNPFVNILISDDGIGRKKSGEVKTKNQKAGQSTGISNTQNRLKLINEIHHIQIHCRISDMNEDGTGTLVNIEIPYIDTDDKKYAELV